MSQLPHYQAMHDFSVSLYFRLCRVSLAEYLLVLRALFPLVTDGQMYYGYCINCLYPAMGEA
jgi:hypothetical protein